MYFYKIDSCKWNVWFKEYKIFNKYCKLYERFNFLKFSQTLHDNEEYTSFTFLRVCNKNYFCEVVAVLVKLAFAHFLYIHFTYMHLSFVLFSFVNYYLVKNER